MNNDEHWAPVAIASRKQESLPPVDLDLFPIPDEFAGTSCAQAYRRYLENPSVRTAKSLLLRRWNIDESVARAETIGTKRTRRGGAGARGDPTKDEALIKAFAMSDMLHDIQQGLETHLWDVARDWFLGQCEPYFGKQQVPSKSFTPMLAQAWVKSCGSSFHALFEVVQSEKHGSFNSDRLSELLQGWSQKPTLNIVLDGILGTRFDDLVQSAFLLIILHGGSKALKTRVNPAVIKGALERIYILDGYFQNIDVATQPSQSFLQRYAEAIQSACRCKDVVVWKPLLPLRPSHLLGYDVTTDHRVVLPNGRVVEYTPNLQWRYGQTKRCPAPIRLPFKKAALQDMVADILGDGPPSSSQDETLLVDAAYLNFFRDAYKADIAIQMDAVFWTGDRLAFVFHELVKRIVGSTTPRGMYIDPNERALILPLPRV